MKANAKLLVATFALTVGAVRSLVIGFVATCAVLLSTAVAEPLVSTEQGRIRGIEMPNVREFLGIPYAAPPVGDMRWKPPNLTRTGPEFSMRRFLATIARRLRESLAQTAPAKIACS
jgi:hypothetical protein